MNEEKPLIYVALTSLGLVSFATALVVIGIRQRELDIQKELAQLKSDVTGLHEIIQRTDGALYEINPPATLMKATWYGKYRPGRRTASGELFSNEAFTCAHRTLPFGTLLLLEHGNRTLLVRVNDRGPEPWTGKELDVTRKSAEILGFKSAGIADLRVRILR